MRGLASAVFLGFLLYAVLSLFATAWDAESAAREAANDAAEAVIRDAINGCLYAGGTVEYCQEVYP